MEFVYSLINSYENLKVRKVNIKGLIEKLNMDIKNKSIELDKLQKLSYYETIKELKDKKCFLEDYPKYLKIGFKGFLNNVVKMFEFLALVFIFVLIFVLIVSINHSIDISFIELLWIDLIFSGGLSFYGTFVEPVIYAHKIKNEIIDKFGSIENLEEEIKKAYILQQENELQIKRVKNEITMKNERVKLLTEQFYQLNICEEKTIQQIQDMADDILKSLSREYYIYEAPKLDDSFKLKLTK